jgi:hypothetical protein
MLPLFKRGARGAYVVIACIQFFATAIDAQIYAVPDSAKLPRGPVVARVRVDGLVVPIAVYAKGSWFAISIDGRLGAASVTESMPSEWHFTPFNGKPSILKAFNIVDILDDDHLFDGWAVTTDLPTRGRTVNYDVPVERVGIATSVPLPVRTFARVTAESAGYQRVHARLLAAFDSTAARRPNNPLTPPVSPTPSINLRLRSLASQNGSATLYEIEATRLFSRKDPGWKLAYYGWAIDDGKRILLLDPNIPVVDADRGTDWPHGFAAVIIDGVTYVVGAVNGYESEDPMIWKWHGATLVPMLRRQSVP